MGNVLLLITAIVGISIQQISQKAYNKKVGGGRVFFRRRVRSLPCSCF